MPGFDYSQADDLHPGYEFGYDQITAPVNVVSTTESAGTTIVACASHMFDGKPVICEFFADLVIPPLAANAYIAISLFEASTQITELAWVRQAVGTVGVQYVPVFARYRFTPSVGAHVYTVSAFVSVTTGTPGVSAGAGGTGAQSPCFVRFTKV